MNRNLQKKNVGEKVGKGNKTAARYFKRPGLEKEQRREGEKNTVKETNDRAGGN